MGNSLSCVSKPFSHEKGVSTSQSKTIITDEEQANEIADRPEREDNDGIRQAAQPENGSETSPDTNDIFDETSEKTVEKDGAEQLHQTTTEDVRLQETQQNSGAFKQKNDGPAAQLDEVDSGYIGEGPEEIDLPKNNSASSLSLDINLEEEITSRKNTATTLMDPEQPDILLDKDSSPNDEKNTGKFFELELPDKTYRLRLVSSDGETESEEEEEENDSILDELLEQIIRLCNEENVDCLDIRLNSKSILVCGSNASGIQEQINKYSKDSGYKVSTYDVDDYLWFEEFQGEEVQLVKHISMHVYRIQRTAQGTLIDSGSVECELIMLGTRKYGKNRSNEHQAFYVLFPAHLTLSNKDCREIVQNNPDIHLISKIRERLRQDFGDGEVEYELRFHNTKIVDLSLIAQPMFCYEHYFCGKDGKSRVHHSHFMKDMAIARIEDTALFTSQIKDSIISAMTTKTVLHNGQLMGFKVAEILNIQDPRVLSSATIRKQKIAVKVGLAISGYLHSVSDMKWQQRMKPDMRLRAWRVELILDSRLKTGDCGLIVYVMDVDSDTLFPLGMIVGEAKIKPESGHNIYQAVLLSQNIEDIEEHYSSEVSGLKVLTNDDKSDSLSNSSSDTLDRAAQSSSTPIPKPRTLIKSLPTADLSFLKTIAEDKDTDSNNDRSDRRADSALGSSLPYSP